MVYMEFSTDKADYVFQGGNHSNPNYQNVFDGVDALVIETGKITLDELVLFYHPQMAVPVQHCANTKVPVYSADVDLTRKGYQRHDWNMFFQSFALMPFWGFILYKSLKYAFSEEKIDGKIPKWISNYHFFVQDPIIEGRNAINAKKIEEFIVPMVAQESGNIKPKIGMVFGAGHISLRYNLESKKRRNFTLKNWEKFNFGRYAGFDKDYLDVVCKAVPNSYNWDFYKFNTGLF
ncbi:MAG: hypothetical protein KKA79_07205 [Nanoarchaeota archaeon]|nr:hypothetical protein [Nanoarchaeota archaeon]